MFLQVGGWKAPPPASKKLAQPAHDWMIAQSLTKPAATYMKVLLAMAIEGPGHYLAAACFAQL